MNTKQEIEFNLTKLQMLQALTRSQAAIASILEQTAAVAYQYQLPASQIREQLRSLASYQSTMITQLSGVQVKRVIRSKPTHRPWLNTKHIP
ncbi:MAG: hypothetical protein WDZ91_12365 [Paenibacillaceae bacterium]